MKFLSFLIEVNSQLGRFSTNEEQTASATALSLSDLILRLTQEYESSDFTN